MVLQSKAHFEKWIVSRCRLLADRAHQFNERNGVGKRVDRQLMSRSQMIGGNARTIDLSAQRNNARVVSHRFPRSLLAAIGDRRSNGKIIESAPLGERNLESAEKRTEQGNTGPTGQFASLVSQSCRNCGKPSLGRARCDRSRSTFDFEAANLAFQNSMRGSSISGVQKARSAAPHAA